jgi:hypothetical protein
MSIRGIDSSKHFKNLRSSSRTVIRVDGVSPNAAVMLSVHFHVFWALFCKEFRSWPRNSHTSASSTILMSRSRRKTTQSRLPHSCRQPTTLLLFERSLPSTLDSPHGFACQFEQWPRLGVLSRAHDHESFIGHRFSPTTNRHIILGLESMSISFYMLITVFLSSRQRVSLPNDEAGVRIGLFRDLPSFTSI